ncbi:hypothetical protein GNI_011090 [Gregarina niphandrodes]|uniref:Uncharacterized protein n=1 Tax=Gregarina niphandrodes TaxID=110365 RepID=A0A023BCV2_GRENI|nr:hypothetical protein GNI_011090 [Gregarina niphandrodes]EZG86042.1 hypothetical protein GNI_011090 [Gregarina niphandrodes]|eukprot:XP_011128797.1 hypothetical protein GNI_011090 [Gregarina niphandrodes]
MEQRDLRKPTNGVLIRHHSATSIGGSSPNNNGHAASGHSASGTGSPQEVCTPSFASERVCSYHIERRFKRKVRDVHTPCPFTPAVQDTATTPATAVPCDGLLYTSPSSESPDNSGRTPASDLRSQPAQDPAGYPTFDHRPVDYRNVTDYRTEANGPIEGPRSVGHRSVGHRLHRRYTPSQTNGTDHTRPRSNDERPHFRPVDLIPPPATVEDASKFAEVAKLADFLPRKTEHSRLELQQPTDALPRLQGAPVLSRDGFGMRPLDAAQTTSVSWFPLPGAGGAFDSSCLSRDGSAGKLSKADGDPQLGHRTGDGLVSGSLIAPDGLAGGALVIPDAIGAAGEVYASVEVYPSVDGYHPVEGYPPVAEGYPAAVEGYPAAVEGYPATVEGYPRVETYQSVEPYFRVEGYGAIELETYPSEPYPAIEGYHAAEMYPPVDVYQAVDLYRAADVYSTPGDPALVGAVSPSTVMGPSSANSATVPMSPTLIAVPGSRGEIASPLVGSVQHMSGPSPDRDLTYQLASPRSLPRSPPRSPARSPSRSPRSIPRSPPPLVSDSVRDSVRNSVRDSVRDSVQDCVRDSVTQTRDSVTASSMESVTDQATGVQTSMETSTPRGSAASLEGLVLEELRTPDPLEEPTGLLSGEPGSGDPAFEPGLNGVRESVLHEPVLHEPVLGGDCPKAMDEYLQAFEEEEASLEWSADACILPPFPNFLHRDQVSLEDYTALVLAVNGIPLTKRSGKLALYSGNTEQLFRDRDLEFRQQYENKWTDMNAEVCKAWPWFSRSTVYQTSDTEMCSWFTSRGEIAIQTQLLNHIVTGSGKRDAIQNCYKTIESLSQLCDSTKYEEERRIQNLLRRFLEHLITIYLADILPAHHNPKLEDVLLTLEDLDGDVSLLTWCVLLYPRYTELVLDSFWDWLETRLSPTRRSTGGATRKTGADDALLNDGLPKDGLKDSDRIRNTDRNGDSDSDSESPSIPIDRITTLMTDMHLVPGEINEDDLAEIWTSVGVACSTNQMRAYSAGTAHVSAPGHGQTLRREQFVVALSHVPFNTPDFRISPLHDEEVGLSVDDLMAAVLRAADDIVDVVVRRAAGEAEQAEQLLSQRRVQVTFTAGTATRTQKQLNARNPDFAVQDFLASYMISCEEIQSLLALDVLDQPLIAVAADPHAVCPNLRVIQLALQLLITATCASMSSAEKFTLRNPMGPLAIEVKEQDVLARSRLVNIPVCGPHNLPPSGGAPAHDLTTAHHDLSAHLQDPRAETDARTPAVLDKCTFVVRAASEVDACIAHRRQKAMDVLSNSFQPTNSPESPAAQQVDSAPPEETRVHLSNDTHLKAFVLLHSAECLIESARVMVTPHKKFPKPAVPLNSDGLHTGGKHTHHSHHSLQTHKPGPTSGPNTTT